MKLVYTNNTYKTYLYVYLINNEYCFDVRINNKYFTLNKLNNYNIVNNLELCNELEKMPIRVFNKINRSIWKIVFSDTTRVI